MPALRICLDSKHLATVCCDDQDSVDVHVSANRISPARAKLEVFGFKAHSSASMHYWLQDLSLESGQRVSVELLETAQSTLQSKSHEEVFAGLNEKPRVDLTLGLARAREHVLALPVTQEHISCVASTKASSASVALERNDFGYVFAASWEAYRPNECRVWVSKSSVEGLRKAQHGTIQFEDILFFGEAALLEVDA